MTTPKSNELPGWPLLLKPELAAAYLGRSLAVFEDEVKRGRWLIAGVYGLDRLAPPFKAGQAASLPGWMRL